MKYKPIAFTLSFITLLLSLTINAKDFKPLKFEESLLKNVPVSGSLLVGFSLLGDIPDTTELVVYALAPEKESWLCVTVKSVDGRYLSSSTYNISVDTTQWIGLKFPSKYIQEIKDYETSEVALLVTAQQNQSSCHKKGQNLLSSWSLPNNPDQRISILINSGRVNSYLRMSNSKQKPKECIDFISSKLVSYDKVCYLQQSDLKNGKWNIIRQRMGERLTPYHFEIFATSDEE